MKLDLAPLVGWVTSAQLANCLAAALVVAIGLLLARFGGAATGRVVARRGTAQQALIARRTVFYGTLGLAVAGALRQLGVDLSVLLGAAGVLTVALGLAAQTSASNLISGLFLIAERPFVVGDVIHVANTTGEVVTIDLLSVKLRTLDNLSVRIPNETLLKAEITNYTRYPIRRVDVRATVGFGQDLARVRRLMEGVAAAQPLCFDEPRPTFSVRGFTEVGIELQLSVWVQRDNVLAVTNSVQEGVQEAFLREGVELPLALRAPRPAAAKA